MFSWYMLEYPISFEPRAKESKDNEIRRGYPVGGPWYEGGILDPGFHTSGCI